LFDWPAVANNAGQPATDNELSAQPDLEESVAIVLSRVWLEETDSLAITAL
jgi:hypothetical protein